MRAVQSMYRLHGKAVLNYLPPDDTSTRKNVLYKNLFDSLTKLDGKNIDTQVKDLSIFVYFSITILSLIGGNMNFII